MNYNNVDQSKLKGLHKVIESYGFNLVNCINLLKKENPEVKKTTNGYYLTNSNLFINLSNL